MIRSAITEAWIELYICCMQYPLISFTITYFFSYLYWYFCVWILYSRLLSSPTNQTFLVLKIHALFLCAYIVWVKRVIASAKFWSYSLKSLPEDSYFDSNSNELFLLLSSVDLHGPLHQSKLDSLRKLVAGRPEGPLRCLLCFGRVFLFFFVSC